MEERFPIDSYTADDVATVHDTYNNNTSDGCLHMIKYDTRIAFSVTDVPVLCATNDHYERDGVV